MIFRKCFQFLSFFLFTGSTLAIAETRVIMTSALIDCLFEERKAEYIKGITAIQSYGLKPWILEATHISSSFLDELSDQVLYPQSNDLSFKNKGINEARCIKACIPHLPFNDDDIVIKLTGRYWLFDRKLIDTIEETHNDYDVYACFGHHLIGDEHIFTGGYGLRWKYLKQVVSSINEEKAEKDWIPIEQIIADFIRENNLRVKVVDPICIEAHIFFDGVFEPNYIRRW